MGYDIYCYFNDEDIEKTNIYAQGGMYDETFSYGSSYINVTGFTSEASFTATPKNGSKFTRWVYRVGSTTSTQQYSYDNPFTYYPSTYETDSTIYIRAEGEENEEETPIRPDKFEWTNEKAQGKPFNLSADEWNDLGANINDVRKFKGYKEYNFENVSSGDKFYYYMYNDYVTAIKDINGYCNYVYKVSQGDKISADLLNNLVHEINDIT